jgi:hypothetical protein
MRQSASTEASTPYRPDAIALRILSTRSNRTFGANGRDKADSISWGSLLAGANWGLRFAPMISQTIEADIPS